MLFGGVLKNGSWSKQAFFCFVWNALHLFLLSMIHGGNHMKNKGKKWHKVLHMVSLISLRLYLPQKKNSNVLTCKMGHIIKECEKCMENGNMLNEFWMAYWKNSFDAAGTCASEVRNPGESYPRAMRISVMLIVAIYGLPALIGFSVIPDPSKWKSGSYMMIAKTIGGHFLEVSCPKLNLCF